MKRKILGCVVLGLSLFLGVLSILLATGAMKPQDNNVLQGVSSGVNRLQADTVGLGGTKMESPDPSPASEVPADELNPVWVDEGGVGRQLDSEGNIRPYIPLPRDPFKDATCSPAQSQSSGLNYRGWVIPSLGVSAPIVTSDSQLTIPSTDNVGVEYVNGAPVNSLSGATLQAGHVNRVTAPWYLSSWGFLRDVQPCDIIVERAEDGTEYTYQAVDKYVVPQTEFKDNIQMFRVTGEKELYLVTCSGASISGDGSAMWNYRYNLVVRFVPVKSA